MPHVSHASLVSIIPWKRFPHSCVFVSETDRSQRKSTKQRANNMDVDILFSVFLTNC